VEPHSDTSPSGFTLIESVVALAIVAVVAAVLLSTHAFQLSARRALQAGAALPAQAERVHVETRLGTDPDGLAAALRVEGWQAEHESTAGSGATAWSVWTLSPTGRPSTRLQVDLRPAGRP
jgi:prepilin-type N-terminal cleavage/methylation domain-containing protein